jgi:hypothetical protein
VLREGGGLINLVRADNPLIFAFPSSITFPVNGGAKSVALTDAGGGPGVWTVSAELQSRARGVEISVPSTITVPGDLAISAAVGNPATSGDVTGFVVLTHGSDSRRIPFWLEVNHPLLGGEKTKTLKAPGLYNATTLGGERKIKHYRYPTSGDGYYPGPEIVYRVTIAHPVANFGVAVVSGKAIPHVVYAGDESHLVGYPGLPEVLNPYFRSFGQSRPVAGAVLPGPGKYDIVFDTRSASAAGKFQFRFWENDTRPPTIHVVSTKHDEIVISATDSGAGVDPQSISGTLDGRKITSQFVNGLLTMPATPGSHDLTVSFSDYQELKNMEDVAKIKANTATLTRTVVVS